MFRALSEAGVNIDMISTSTIRITCVIDAAQAETAVRALHDSFGLEETEIVAETSPGCGDGE
jgi:aspartate kinase